jgi:CRP/FNR family transcriptional regulator
MSEMPSRHPGELGKVYADGEIIARQGDVGEQMFVVQSGRVEVVLEGKTGSERLAVLGAGDFFGEMALFDKVVRSATAQAMGQARVLTVDKRTLLKRISEDPLLAVNLLRTMSTRIRTLNNQLVSARNRSA